MINLGKYTLEDEPLGRGGFGAVYLALDTVLEVKRAVKILHPVLASDPQFIERFRREAKTAARLKHPNIVQVYDLGEDQGRYFLAMEYLPGGSLKDHLARSGPLPYDKVLVILRQTAAALDFAHHHGLVHRDIKPGNILFDSDGTAKLADFGFARALSSVTDSATLSITGGMVGTPAYMAPEVWKKGKEVGPAADQYSLACVCYEMLTEQVLFDADSPAEVMTLHVLDGPQFPSTWPVDVPAGVSAVLSKALGREPGQRYATTEEFVKTLDELKQASVNLALESPGQPMPSEKSEQEIDAQTLYQAEELAPSKVQVQEEPANQATVKSTSVEQIQNEVNRVTQHETEASMGTKDSLQHTAQGQVQQLPIVQPALKVHQPFQQDRQSQQIEKPQLSFAQSDHSDTPAAKPLWQRPVTWVTGSVVAVILVVLLFAWWNGQNYAGIIPATPVITGMGTHSAVVVSTPLATTQSGDISTQSLPATQETLTATPAPSPTATPSASPTALPTLQLPVLAGTALPQVTGLISLDNASQLVQLAQWGRGSAHQIAWSPDGSVFAVAFSDSISLYNADTLAEKLQFDGYIIDMVFTSDGKALYTLDGNYVKEWNIADGSLLNSVKIDTNDLWPIVLSPDGQTIAGVTSDNEKIALLQVSDSHLLFTLEGHTDNIWNLIFSPYGEMLASSSSDETVRLWKVADGSLLKVLGGHEYGAEMIAFSPDGKTLASSTLLMDQIKLWQVSDGLLIDVLEVPESYIGSLAFSPDGQTLASGDMNNSVRLWSVSGGRLLNTFEGEVGGVESLAFSPNGQTLAVGSVGGAVQLWNTSGNQPAAEIGGAIDITDSAAFSPDGQNLAIGSASGMISLWKISEGKVLREFKGHTKGITSVTFSPDGGILASSSEDNSIKLWDVATGNVINTLNTGTSYAMDLAFSPDGHLLASALLDKRIKLWRVADGYMLRRLDGHTRIVYSVAFSPDGKLLASGSTDSTVRLWNVSDGSLLNTLKGHTKTVYSVAFSPDGQTLASGSSDKTIRLWRVADGSLLSSLEGNTHYVNSLAFSPNGQILVSSSFSGKMIGWKMPEGSILFTLESSGDIVFSPQGELIAAVGYGKVIIWGIPVP